MVTNPANFVAFGSAALASALGAIAVSLAGRGATPVTRAGKWSQHSDPLSTWMKAE